MSNVVRVEFGAQRKWQKMRERQRESFRSLGEDLGDDLALLELKADRSIELLREMWGYTTVNVKFANGIPPDLAFSREQVDAIDGAVKAACDAGYRAAVKRCTKVYLKAQDDLCTSVLLGQK